MTTPPYSKIIHFNVSWTVTDPGIPVGGGGGGGGADPFGGTNLRRTHFSVITYAKMKELGPVGDALAAPPGRPTVGPKIYTSGHACL